MPIPKARKGQSLDSFMSGCMGSEVMKKEYPEQKVRLGVCYSQYRKKHGKKSAPKKT